MNASSSLVRVFFGLVRFQVYSRRCHAYFSGIWALVFLFFQIWIAATQLDFWFELQRSRHFSIFFWIAELAVYAQLCSNWMFWSSCCVATRRKKMRPNLMDLAITLKRTAARAPSPPRAHQSCARRHAPQDLVWLPQTHAHTHLQESGQTKNLMEGVTERT